MEKLIAIGLGIIGQIFIIKYVFFKTLRLKSFHTKQIYDLIKSSNGLKFIINESIIEKENEQPTEFSGFFKIKKHPPFYLTQTERLLTAGYQSKESIGSITFFRWNSTKIKKIFSFDEEENTEIQIYIQEGYSVNYLGNIPKDKDIKINPLVSQIENDILRMEKGEINKTSSLLYGPPGNGKTTVIRDLAKKYGYRIYFVNFNNQLKNSEILAGLSYIPERSFVVFEDFDSVFNKRICTSFEKPTFSFDVILNSLDGIYNNYNKMVFFITANDISKIDSSITDRNSRMKWKILFDNPTRETIFDILKDIEVTDLCDGLNLDNIYFIEDLLKTKGKTYTIKWLIDNINQIKLQQSEYKTLFAPVLQDEQKSEKTF